MYGFFKNKRIVLYDTLIQQVRKFSSFILLNILLKQRTKTAHQGEFKKKKYIYIEWF